MRIGTWCGSLAKRSSNAALLRVAADRIRESGHEAVPLGAVSSIPPFDPVLADDAPAPVVELRARIRACHALVIAVPEYAAGVAGSTKNALDWLVGDGTLDHKVVGVASAGTTGGRFAIEQVVRTVSWQGGLVVATLGIAAPRTLTDADGAFNDSDALARIVSWAETILGAVDAGVVRREELVSGVVCAYDIDPARFGGFEIEDVPMSGSDIGDVPMSGSDR